MMTGQYEKAIVLCLDHDIHPANLATLFALIESEGLFARFAPRALSLFRLDRTLAATLFVKHWRETGPAAVVDKLALEPECQYEYLLTLFQKQTHSFDSEEFRSLHTLLVGRRRVIKGRGETLREI